MKKWKIKKNVGEIEGLITLVPMTFIDERGSFTEIYNKEELLKYGIDKNFVQVNSVESKQGVLRGLHFQQKHSQGKLINVIRGAIFDVAVDIRKHSSTFGKWHGILLSSKNRIQFYIPEGFAHGYYVLENHTIVNYRCTDYYYPDDECGIIWNDPDLSINWVEYSGNTSITLSQKDKKWGYLKQLKLV